MQRLAPAESPAKTMLEGDTGVCMEPGGGYRRER